MKLATVFVSLCFILFAVQVSAETRIALVVANADYGKFGTLNTPLRDAKAISDKLSGLGFQVQRRSNLNRRDFKKTLQDFLRSARLADKALIYYSGNQLTLNDKLYLVPSGEAPTTVNQALLSLVSVDAITRRFSTAAAQNFLILEGGWKTGIVTNLGGNLRKGAVKSLRSAQTKLVAPDEAVLALATSGEKINARERGSLSRFTRELVKNLDQRGKTLDEILRQTAQRVSETTKGEQVPAIYGKLQKPIYLAGRPLVLPQTNDLVEEARTEWERIKGSNITDEFDVFLERYETTPYAGPALNRLYELRAADPQHLKKLRAQTIERRALLKSLEIERTKKNIISEQLKFSPYPLRVILSKYEVSANVAVRDQPNSLGGWLGLYKAGDKPFVVGKVLNKNWLQVEWQPGRRAKAATDTSPAVKAKSPKFGYFFAKVARPIGQQEADVWEAVSGNPSPVTLRAYLDTFKNGYHRFDATQKLLELKYPETLVSSEIENEGYLEADGDLKGLRLSARELPKGRYSRSEVKEKTTTSSGSSVIKIPEMGYKLEVFEEEYIVKERANLRRLPWIKTRRMAVVEADQKIVVTGKVKEVDWYRVKWGGGRDLYVFGSLVEPYASSDYAVWQEVKASGDLSDLRFYLQSFPKGRYAKLATKMMTDLQRGDEQISLEVVSPKQLVDLNLTADSSLRKINVVPIEFNGEESASLSSQIRYQLGRSLKASVSSEPQPEGDSFMNVTGRILQIKVEGDEAKTLKPFDLLLGDREGKPKNEEKKVDYYVVVQLGAAVDGYDFPIVTMQEAKLNLPAETAQSVAIELALKDAFKRAADDVLVKLQKVL